VTFQLSHRSRRPRVRAASPARRSPCCGAGPSPSRS